MPLSLAARADEGKEISQMKLDVTEEASGKCTKGVSLKLVCVCVCVGGSVARECPQRGMVD